jgi:hypothetical protein
MTSPEQESNEALEHRNRYTVAPLLHCSNAPLLGWGGAGR